MSFKHRSRLSNKAINISLISHILIIVLFILFPDTQLFFRNRPMKVVWVNFPAGSSDNIDLGVKETKTLPKSTIQQQKAKPKPNDTTKNQMKEPAKKVAKKQRKSATDRKIDEALAKIDKEIKEERKVPEAAQIKSSGEGFKHGTGDTPLKAMPDDPEYLKYQAMVRSKIINEWIIPLKFLEEDSPKMNSRLEVMINTNGDVVSIRWDVPSGNASFDSSAVRAIKKASPFPNPPAKIAWEVYNEGFLVEFDPKMK